MPMINGVKMACQPCIRGHRSTKCDHTGRIMVVVKKPGRPLSSCPGHQPSELCNCHTVTAAIQKKNHCECGKPSGCGSIPLAPHSHDRPVSSIMEPSCATNISFKVRKSGASSRPSSRKQSYDLNLFNACNAMANISSVDGQRPPTRIAPAMSSEVSAIAQEACSIPNLSSEYGCNTPAYYPHNTSLAGRSMVNPMASLSITSPPFDAQHSELHSAFDSPSAVAATRREYFAANRERLAGLSSAMPPLSGTTDGMLMQQIVSCNSTTPTTREDIRMPVSHERFTQPHQSNSSSSNGQCTPYESTPSMTPSLSNDSNTSQDMSGMVLPQQQTLFAYPANYGSFEQPLQHDQWYQNSVAQAHHQQDIVADSYVPVLQQSADLTNTAVILPEQESMLDPSSLHSCTCGPGCSCMGCIAHPFNDRTRNFIEAYATGDMDGPMADLPNEVLEAYGFSSLGELNMDNAMSVQNDQVSSPAFTGPLSTASDQILNERDYLFVTYDVRYPAGGCNGDAANCPCGDGCECANCRAHVPRQYTDANGSHLYPADNDTTDSDDRPVFAQSSGTRNCCGSTKRN